MRKNLRNILIVMATVAILLAIIFNEFLTYSAIFVAAMVVFYALYSAFLRTKDAEIEDLQTKLADENQRMVAIQSENDELRNRKLNLASIREILDLGLFELETNFTRTWNEEMINDEGKTVQFIGALRVDLKAKYGIELKELRVKRVGDEVHIANMELKALSFTDLDYNWVISEVLEHKKPYLGGSHRRTNVFLEVEANRIKERLQKRIHEEVKKGPEELDPMIKVLKKHLQHSVASVLGVPDEKIRFIEQADEGFKALDTMDGLIENPADKPG